MPDADQADKASGLGIGGMDQAWLDTLPTTPVTDTFDDFPTRVAEDEGVVVSTRIPAYWIQQIDAIRERPGTHMPNIFPTRSVLLRWCVAQGFKRLVQISTELNDPNYSDHDPILAARIFVEQAAGRVAARAQTMSDASEKASQIGAAAVVLVQMGEFDEAIQLFEAWCSGAREQADTFWRTYFYKALIMDEACLGCLRRLHSRHLIHDEYLIELLDSAVPTPGHLLDDIPQAK